jgi:hypothetical protein
LNPLVLAAMIDAIFFERHMQRAEFCHSEFCCHCGGI